jgi:regulator of sigma D
MSVKNFKKKLIKRLNFLHRLVDSTSVGKFMFYIRVIHKVTRLGGENGQFQHSKASNV